MIIGTEGPDGAALFDQAGVYRWLLTRTWGPGIWLFVVMLNPSTADAFADDRTISRVIWFAKRLGYGGIVVANLFALRATDPRVMLAHPDPVGDMNDAVLNAVCQHFPIGQDVLCAWGALGGHQDRDTMVLDLLAGHGLRLCCLGTTKAGMPRHPLYLRSDTPMERLAI